jgi:MATE family multidrug resistance protein
MSAAARDAGLDPYRHGAIWALAAPMILASITAPLVGLVGTGVIGHLDDAVYLAGVAVGAQVFSILFLGLNFLRMGTTGFAAQAFGSGNHARIRGSLGEAVLVALLLGLLLVLLQWPVREASIALLGPGERVATFAREYFDIRIWAAPAALFNFVAIGWLLGTQNARGPLLITLAINVTNVGLDLWFVLGLGMKVRGVAAGSLLAEITGAAVAAFLLARELRLYPSRWDLAALFDYRAYAAHFRVNGNLFVRTLALMFVFSFVTAAGARMGSVVLAVNAILMNFQWLLSYALDGIANAAEALVGRAIGARDRRGVEVAVRRTLRWSALFAALFTAGYLAGGAGLVRLLTDLPEVRTEAARYLPWLIASPLISVWSFLYDGVYVGATRGREMRVVMTASALLVFLPTWFVFRELGNHAIWLAFTAFMAARGIGMHLWYRQLLASGALLSPAR